MTTSPPFQHVMARQMHNLAVVDTPRRDSPVYERLSDEGEEESPYGIVNMPFPASNRTATHAYLV